MQIDARGKRLVIRWKFEGKAHKTCCISLCSILEHQLFQALLANHKRFAECTANYRLYFLWVVMAAMTAFIKKILR